MYNDELIYTIRKIKEHCEGKLLCVNCILWDDNCMFMEGNVPCEWDIS